MNGNTIDEELDNGEQHSLSDLEENPKELEEVCVNLEKEEYHAAPSTEEEEEEEEPEPEQGRLI